MRDDHYALLGVEPDADATDIRTAYLHRMRATHPDRHPADPAAAMAAQRVNAAYTVLRDPRRRAAYDRRRAAADPPARGAPLPTTVGRHDPPGGNHDGEIAAKGRQVRRRFHRACLRVGMAILALGVVLLATTA